MTTSVPEPPGHLAAAGEAYWREVLEEWAIEPHLLPVLENACSQLDRIAQSRNRVRRDGLIVLDKTGNKPIAHPALSVERQAMKTHLQLAAALKLKDDPDPIAVQARLKRGGRPRKDDDYTPQRAQ